MLIVIVMMTMMRSFRFMGAKCWSFAVHMIEVCYFFGFTLPLIKFEWSMSTHPHTHIYSHIFIQTLWKYATFGSNNFKHTPFLFSHTWHFGHVLDYLWTFFQTLQLHFLFSHVVSASNIAKTNWIIGIWVDRSIRYLYT